MSELAEPLRRVLGETGYLKPDGRPAASTVTICNGDEPQRGTLKPDVRWRHANLNVYFKFEENPAPEAVGAWQREVWNEGTVPLLWLVEPHQTTLYNGFAAPQGPVAERRLDAFALPTARAQADAPHLGLRELTARAGRLSMETGRFWQEERRVNREQTVDTRLLSDLEQLQGQLQDGGLSVPRAQALISRTIFAQYLVDRGIITEQRLQRKYGAESPATSAKGAGLPAGCAARDGGFVADRAHAPALPDCRGRRCRSPKSQGRSASAPPACRGQEVSKGTSSVRWPKAIAS